MDKALVTLRPAALIIAVTCFLLFIGGPLAVAVIVAFLAPWEVSVPIALGAVVLVALLGHGMLSSIQWVELDGTIIRGRRLFTRKLIDQRGSDIVAAHGIRTQPMGPLENAVLDFMLQTRDPGFILVFRDGMTIRLIKADLSDLHAFMGQLAAQMKCEQAVAER
jgi:hypothetical protein